MKLGISADIEEENNPYAGFFTWECKTSTVYADRAMAKLYGLAIEEAETGLPLEDFVSKIHKDDRPQFGDTARSSLLKRAPFQASYRIVKADRSAHSVTAFSQPFFNKNGALIYYSGIIIPGNRSDENLDALLWHCITALDLAKARGRAQIVNILSAAIAQLADDPADLPSNDN